MLSRPVYRGLGMDTFLCLWKERGEPSEREEGKPAHPQLLACVLGPRTEGACWCQGGGWSQQKAEMLSALPHKKKASKVQGPWPLLPQPLVRKSAKHYHKKGVSEGPSAKAPEAHALALRCPGHRVRRGRALGGGALGWPEAGPGSGRAMSCRRPVGTPPHTFPLPTQGFRRPLPAPARGSEP